MHKVLVRSKRLLIGIVGGTVVLVGLILVPYPGPGWLIVFGGLAILATEFESAERILAFARGKYDAWLEWIKRQSWVVQGAIAAVTGLVVVSTLWLLNTFGMMSAWIGLDYDWLTSPLFR